MQKFALFFEIGDKVIEVQAMYILFTILGGIGLLLGFWRWWISFIWFIFPTSVIALLFIWLQTEEINSLYKHIIRELGESYIWHNYISVTIGILLNLTGIFVGVLRRKKINLQ